MKQNNQPGETITKDLLHELLPIIRMEHDSGSPTRAKKDAERAKQRLYAAAYPLIVEIARKEFSRRQQWQSMVTMEDLIQDGSVGLFKALSGFDLTAMGGSATHYLGQWILVNMRRGAEGLDHDFQIGVDQAQKFRKIRAIRGRLHNELGYEPTDEQVVEASLEAGHSFSGTYLGPKNPSPTSKGVTLLDVQQEREYSERFGSVERIDASFTQGDDFEGTIQLADAESDPADIITDVDSNEQMKALISIVIRTMEIEDDEKDIIARHYGLSPHEESHSLRAIARDMDWSRDRVARVIRQFNEAVKTPGGVLFQLLDAMSGDDRHALDVQWIWEQVVPVSTQADTLDEES